jgi:hypothetical protein
VDGVDQYAGRCIRHEALLHALGCMGQIVHVLTVPPRNL